MDLIPTTSDCLSITSLSVSPSRRFIAVAESTSERGIVNIYDANTMRRRKMLDLKELESKRINWVVFSADTKQVRRRVRGRENVAENEPNNA